MKLRKRYRLTQQTLHFPNYKTHTYTLFSFPSKKKYFMKSLIWVEIIPNSFSCTPNKIEWHFLCSCGVLQTSGLQMLSYEHVISIMMVREISTVVLVKKNKFCSDVKELFILDPTSYHEKSLLQKNRYRIITKIVSTPIYGGKQAWWTFFSYDMWLLLCPGVKRHYLNPQYQCTLSKQRFPMFNWAERGFGLSFDLPHI